MSNLLKMLLASEGDLNLNKGAYIIFTFIGIVVLILLTILLFFRVKKDYYMAKYIGYDKGLMNIERFKIVADKLAKLKTKSLKYGIFQVDIRKFNSIKNSVGEEQFKAIIKGMVDIMQKLVPWGIRITNVNQKTFYVIMVINEENTVENLCRLLINNLSREYELGAGLNVEVNVNVAAGNIPEVGNTFDEMQKSLDITMVISRRQGENHYVLYNLKYTNEKTLEYQYYQEIKEAIEQKEFILYYQPVVETNNFEVVSAESLIRWAHKTKGILPPKEFLTLMEQTGDINWSGMWSVEEMITQLNSWQAECDKKFTVSCNLSEKQLLNPKLFAEYKRIIRKHKIEPSSLVFEISDIGMYNISDVVKANIDGLSELGCKIFIDDFGNKFSAPTGLLDLPISGIKIGRNFWRKIETSTIVKNTINILIDYAKEKGLMLVTVGVENREEMNNLRAMGINYMQGYIFAPQKDPNDFISDVKIKPWEANLKRKSSRPSGKSGDGDKPVEESASEPVEKPEEPVENPAEPAEETVEQPVEKEEKPASKSSKKKAGKPADNPPEGEGDKPADASSAE